MKYGVYAVTLNKNIMAQTYILSIWTVVIALSSAMKKQHCARGGPKNEGRHHLLLLQVHDNRGIALIQTRVRLTVYEVGGEKCHNY